MSLANWVVGLMLISVMSIKVFWGADLLAAAHLRPRRRRWRILRDGTLYLGWYFIVSALAVYGLFGVALLTQPNETVPLWYAVPVAVLTIDCVLAWHFLGQPSPEEDE